MPEKADAAPVSKDALDTRYQIRDYFRQALPDGWWVTDPVKGPWGWEVTLTLPDAWGGNPTSAAMRLCPPRGSVIWRQTDSVTIHTMHHKRPWPGFECMNENG